MEDALNKNNRLAYYYIWISILLSVILIGLYGVLMSFVEGMEILEFNLFNSMVNDDIGIYFLRGIQHRSLHRHITRSCVWSKRDTSL